MASGLLAARCFLGLVFAVAGLAKLAGSDALRDTLLEFGLPSRLTRVGAIALPAAELAVAALLLPTATARWGAAAALVLLAGFCAAIARALARGEHPDCGCLGSKRSQPISPVTLARNLVLGGIAAFVLTAGPGRSLGDVLTGVDISPLAAVAAVVGILVALQGWFLWQLFLQNGRLLARVRALEDGDAQPPSEGLAVGVEAPPLELPGGRALDDLLAGGLPVALIFSSPGCDSCMRLLPELQRLGAEREGEFEIALVDEDRDALEAYRIFTVPSATLVGRDGRIASGTATGAAAVKELLEASANPASELLRLTAG